MKVKKYKDCELAFNGVDNITVISSNYDEHQVKDMVKYFLNLEKMPRLDDTTDALAIAICHTHTSRFDSFVNKGK